MEKGALALRVGCAACVLPTSFWQVLDDGEHWTQRLRCVERTGTTDSKTKNKRAQHPRAHSATLSLGRWAPSTLKRIHCLLLPASLFFRVSSHAATAELLWPALPAKDALCAERSIVLKMRFREINALHFCLLRLHSFLRGHAPGEQSSRQPSCLHSAILRQATRRKFLLATEAVLPPSKVLGDFSLQARCHVSKLVVMFDMTEAEFLHELGPASFCTKGPTRKARQEAGGMSFWVILSCAFGDFSSLQVVAACRRCSEHSQTCNLAVPSERQAGAARGVRAVDVR